MFLLITELITTLNKYVVSCVIITLVFCTHLEEYVVSYVVTTKKYVLSCHHSHKICGLSCCHNPQEICGPLVLSPLSRNMLSLMLLPPSRNTSMWSLVLSPFPSNVIFLFCRRLLGIQPGAQRYNKLIHLLNIAMQPVVGNTHVDLQRACVIH